MFSSELEFRQSKEERKEMEIWEIMVNRRDTKFKEREVMVHDEVSGYILSVEIFIKMGKVGSCSIIESVTA